jgi:hypothetical protein
MKNCILICLLSIVCSSCHFASKQVEYAEMDSVPVVNFKNNSLIVHTKNSKWHSALSIYKIEANVDVKKKIINIFGYEAAGEPYNETFIVNLDEYNIPHIEDYTLNWSNPNGTLSPLTYKIIQ